MATYKESVGTTVTNFSGNYPGAVEGELWYDSSAYAWKYQYPNVTSTGSWASGGSVNTARKSAGGCGIKTAALCFGGTSDPPQQALTEQYNGSSWTEVNDLNTARAQLGSEGTYTSALAIGGGGTTVITEIWNGSNWTETGDLNNGRGYPKGAGPDSTAALAFGGTTPSGPEISTFT